jgi:hypothetical protein
MEIARCDESLPPLIAAPNWSYIRRRRLIILLRLAVIASACWLAALKIAAAAPPQADDDGAVSISDQENSASADAVARIASMQPQLPPATAPGAAGPSAARSAAASPLGLGASLRRLGGPRGPQASAPPVIGDRFGGGLSCITIPVMSGPGIALPRTIQAGSSSVPFQFPLSGAIGDPLRITSPNEPPAFPSRTFLTTGDYDQANQAFQNGGNVPLQNNPDFNQDAQNAILASAPAGAVLPNGPTSAGGGTVQPLSTQAVLDPSSTDPANGRVLTNDDLFFIRGNYLFIPNVVFGPDQPTVVCINSASAGAAVLGTVKLAENTSPLPRDRVFFNYSLFDNTSMPGGRSVNRFIPGFEKTFFDQLTSIEMRFPFAATISPELAFSNAGVNTVDDVVFGNLTVVFKGLLYQTDVWAYSGGLQVAVPTAPDLNVSLVDGTKVVAVDNESVHLMPFLGALYTPNERLFMQGFLQLDADANGNPVSINPRMLGLTEIGRLHDSTFMYADFNIGYWLYRSEESWLTGFAPTFEVHYNTSLDKSESLASQGFVVGRVLNQFSNLNLTAGCYFELGLDSTFVVGYTAPLGNGADQQFDGELRAFFTHRFGANTRANRVSIL